MHPSLSLLVSAWLSASPAGLPQGSDIAAPTARSLTLGEAVELAMRVDPLMAEAEISRDRSKLAVLRAQLDRVSLKVDGQLQELWTDANLGGPTECNVSPGATQAECNAIGGQMVGAQQQGVGFSNLAANLTVPLFSGFKVEANVGQAQRLEDASEATIRQQRKDTALAVARAYWNVRRIGLLLDVQEAALARMRESEAVAAARLEAGLAPPIDRNRAVARRLQQEATLADLAGQQHEASVQLAVALGLSEDLVLTDPPSIPAEGPPAVAELLAGARDHRPELKVFQLQMAAQDEAIRKAKSAYFPQLAAFVLFQLGNDPFITGQNVNQLVSSSLNPFAGESGNLQLGVSLSINLFDTFNTTTAVRDARYEQARLSEELRRVSRVVESDVRLAHAKLLHLYSQRTPLLQAREVAKDNLGILQGRYKNGEALIIDLLDAQIDLVGVERQLADLTAQLRLAWLELDASLGKVVGESGETS